jgi:hypothetical protein
MDFHSSFQRILFQREAEKRGKRGEPYDDHLTEQQRIENEKKERATLLEDRAKACSIEKRVGDAYPLHLLKQEIEPIKVEEVPAQPVRKRAKPETIKKK